MREGDRFGGRSSGDRRGDRQLELAGGDFIAFLGPKLVLGQREGDAEEILGARLGLEFMQRNGDHRFGPRNDSRHGQRAFLDLHAVFAERPGGVEPGQIDELVLVLDLYLAGRQVGGLDADPLVSPLHLGIVRLGRAIGGDNALVNEVMVVGHLAEAAAVGQDGMLRVAAVPKALVLPFPDRPADDFRIAVEDVAVLGQRAHRVEHGVGEFADVERLGQVLALGNAGELGRRAVHLLVEVGRVALAHAEPLVMHGPGRVDPLDRVHRVDEVLAASAALVAQRPDHDGGVVLEVLHVGHAAVDDRVAHERLVVEVAVVAVALAVGLGHQPDTVLVAQFVPARVVGVMAGADVVAVALLEHFQVADHLRLGNRMADLGPMLVPVHAFELDGRAVHEELPALDLDLAETDLGGKKFVGQRIDAVACFLGKICR